MSTTNAPQHTTLSQLQRSIQECVVERFAMPLWISAEISDIKVNSSGHCYMELVEKGESDGVAKAQARAVIWRSAYTRIAQLFEAQSGERLSRGIKILAKVLVTYHELYGMSLQVTDIDPTYTLGEVERQRLEAIAKLKSTGSWDKNRELELPQLTQRIAVVSSSQAAGYQDFIRELHSGGYHFDLTLFEATMQGSAAEGSIIEALIAIANRREEFDGVVVIRGGGSSNDLRCFDSYRLALHFARFPLPVISGIGHDKDVSVVDMVANTYLKTPTAVAGWLTERMMSLDAALQNSAIEIHRLTVERSRSEHITIEGFFKELTMRCEERVNNEKRNLISMVEELPELAYNLITTKRREIDNASTIIEGFSPRRLLELGFAVARSSEHSVRSIAGVKVGDELSITVADGEIETVVKSIKSDK